MLRDDDVLRMMLGGRGPILRGGGPPREIAWICDGCQEKFGRGDSCRYTCVTLSDYDLCRRCRELPSGTDRFGHPLQQLIANNTFWKLPGTKVVLRGLTREIHLNGTQGVVVDLTGQQLPANLVIEKYGRSSSSRSTETFESTLARFEPGTSAQPRTGQHR